MQPDKARIGTSLLADCRLRNPPLFEDPENMEHALDELIRRANLTLLSKHIRTFQPEGITAIAILGESHIVLHTWPTLNYLAIDIFACGPIDTQLIHLAIKEIFDLESISMNITDRRIP